MEELEHGYHDDNRVNVKPLLASLKQALEALEADDVLVDALGGPIVELFMSAKSLEWGEYNRQVTQWELDTYLRSY